MSICQVDLRNHMLAHCPDAPGEGAIMGNMSRPVEQYRERIRSVLEKSLMQSRRLLGCVRLGPKTTCYVRA